MIYIGSDHGGFAKKEYVKKVLKSLGLTFTDMGPYDFVKDDDYPEYANKVCEKITEGDFGILICDTGIGISIAANRYRHIRAALCSGIFEAMRAREHNDANVLAFGSEVVEDDNMIKAIVKVFFDTPFSNEERHIRRIQEIS